MTQNPFGEGQNPFGNLDLGAVLEQAQQMQAQMAQAQADLAQTILDGNAGGVTVSITGAGDLTGVTIAPGSFDADDAESLSDLGDLVVAAFRDAKSRADAAAAAALGPLAGALGGGFGTPGDDGPTPAPLGFGQ